jgi:hypothetical protein
MFDIFYSGPKPNLFAHEQPAKSIEHAQELSRTRYFWWTNYLTDYSQHDFLWEPVPWEATQRHVWPSQHQDNGGTQLVPKLGGADINYNHPVLPRNVGVSIIGIDHGNGLSVNCDITTRFINSYLGTLRRVLSKLDPVTNEYVWVVSSVCDYTWFNFTWHPSEWQQEMLHVFPSQDQKFGDTFYIHVPTFLERSKNLALLEWYDTINFVENIQVPRRPIPVVKHSHDTHVQAVWEYEFQDPVVEFTVDDSTTSAPTLNLWREEVRAVTPLTPGASRVLVPRDAKNYLKTQLYDYPIIDKTNRNGVDRPLDIVFIDNGEANADHNYFHLKWAVERASDNNIYRSSGVNGRVAAYQAAARLSTTPWFFAVFAKLKIDKHFDWSWQPDRLQEPKHYIFYAFNPINGLTYGHQAMIAYNRELVLGNTGTGLDFTLDSAHEVVPVVSGQAEYCDTKWSAWRTAFREVLKLKSNTDVDSQYRLSKWLTVAHGQPNGEWSIYGAEDAVEYYDTVAGEFEELKKSYDWAWLASYAFMRRSLLTSQ